jgi:hypothetical protein
MQRSGRTKSGQIVQPDLVKSCEKTDGREELSGLLGCSEAAQISSMSLECNADNFPDPECFPVGIYDDVSEPPEAGFTTALAEPWSGYHLLLITPPSELGWAVLFNFVRKHGWKFPFPEHEPMAFRCARSSSHPTYCNSFAYFV